MARGPLFLRLASFSNTLNNSEISPLDTRGLSCVGAALLPKEGFSECAPFTEEPSRRLPSALPHSRLPAQPMQAMAPPLVQGCWDLASEPLSAARSHRKRCTSRRPRRFITHHLHRFTSRRLSTSRQHPFTLDRRITGVRIEVIDASDLQPLVGVLE